MVFAQVNELGTDLIQTLLPTPKIDSCGRNERICEGKEEKIQNFHVYMNRIEMYEEERRKAKLEHADKIEAYPALGKFLEDYEFGHIKANDNEGQLPIVSVNAFSTKTTFFLLKVCKKQKP